MHEHMLASVANLSEEALLARLQALAAQDRKVSVELIATIAELDVRRSHLGEGVNSPYRICTDVLRFSEHAAYNESRRRGRRGNSR